MRGSITVVDEDIQFAKSLDVTINDLLALSFIPYVRGHEVGPSASFFDLGLGPLRILLFLKGNVLQKSPPRRKFPIERYLQSIRPEEVAKCKLHGGNIPLHRGGIHACILCLFLQEFQGLLFLWRNGQESFLLKSKQSIAPCMLSVSSLTLSS